MSTMRRLLVSLLGAASVAGCGPSGPTPAPTAPPTASARPTPTPTPPPDTQRVDVVSTGVGVYMAVVVPVAVLHNAATRTGVSGVIVHFVPTRGGRPTTPLDSPAVTLYPGETLAVSADCTDTCNCTAGCSNPDAVSVTVGAGTWAPLPGSPITAGGVNAACQSGCGGGHGQWDVTATIAGPGLAQGTRVDVTAWCVNGSGAIVGGSPPYVVGSWPQPGGSLAVDIPAILSAPPASCQVTASAPT